MTMNAPRLTSSEKLAAVDRLRDKYISTPRDGQRGSLVGSSVAVFRRPPAALGWGYRRHGRVGPNVFGNEIGMTA